MRVSRVSPYRKVFAFVMSYPWEKPSLEDTVCALQRDFAFAVRHTAVLVRSSNADLRMIANTERGQEMPKGVCVLTDGSTIEFQDIGMPHPNMPTMSMQDLVKAVFAKATELGLEIA